MNHRYYRSCLQPTPSFRCRCKCAASRRGLAALNETIRQSSRSAGASAFFLEAERPARCQKVGASERQLVAESYRPGAVGEQNNCKLVAMLGLLSKLIRQSGRLRGNDPQRALCHPTILREASSSGAQIRNDTPVDMEQTLHLQAQGLDWICRDHSGSNRLSLRCGWVGVTLKTYSFGSYCLSRELRSRKPA